MAYRDSENSSPFLLKIITALCAATLSTMWIRMDNIDAKIERLLVSNSAVETATNSHSGRLNVLESDVKSISQKLYALKPDEITIKRQAQ